VSYFVTFHQSQLGAGSVQNLFCHQKNIRLFLSTINLFGNSSVLIQKSDASILFLPTVGICCRAGIEFYQPAPGAFKIRVASIFSRIYLELVSLDIAE
jgi:hypothetical protein